MAIDETLLEEHASRCPTCGYVLRATIVAGHSRCPECGASFKLAVRRSEPTLLGRLIGRVALDPATPVVLTTLISWAILLHRVGTDALDIAEDSHYALIIASALWPGVLVVLLLVRRTRLRCRPKVVLIWNALLWLTTLIWWYSWLWSALA